MWRQGVVTAGDKDEAALPARSSATKPSAARWNDTLSQNKKLNLAVRTSTSKGVPDAVNLVDLSKAGLTFTLDNFRDRLRQSRAGRLAKLPFKGFRLEALSRSRRHSNYDTATAARDRLLLAGVSAAAISLATFDFDAGRDLSVRLAFGFSVPSAGADAAGFGGRVAFATGLRPNPASFANVERRSENAGAVSG